MLYRNPDIIEIFLEPFALGRRKCNPVILGNFPLADQSNLKHQSLFSAAIYALDFTYKVYICSMNYFELFELPVSIKIDQGKLAQTYFELQKKYHPDFFTQATEQEQEEALEISSHLNKALKVLKNQDETIKYVLQLKGLLGEEEKYQLPAAFLMEMMELNEELSPESAGQIAGIEKDIYAAAAPIIESFNDQTVTQAELMKLKEYYYKKKYLKRILDRLAG